MTFYPGQSAAFGEAIAQLRGKKVAVLGHQRPDGDCVGSQVAMVRALQALGAAEAVALNRDRIPPILRSFVGETPYLLADEFEPDGHIAVSTDCADRKRFGQRLNELFGTIYLNIDHHISNTGYGEKNFILPETSATAEILAAFFLDNGYPLDAVTAQALYVGIATDTGQFRFPTTTQQVFRLAGRLVAAGADPGAASLELYERETPGRLALLRHFLTSLKIEAGGRVCIGVLPEGIYEKTGADAEDSEGLVDYARAIDGVEIGVLIEERDGRLKGSLRAKHAKYRVDQIAKAFNAAGFNTEGTLNEIYPSMVEAIEQQLKRVDTGEGAAAS